MHGIDTLRGTRLVWPVTTKEVTDEGLIAAGGALIPGDMVIVAIGETPDLSYLPEGVNRFRDRLAPAADLSILEGVFAAGDVIRPGRLVDAIGAGSKAADAADAYVRGETWTFGEKKEAIPAERLGRAYFERRHACDLPDRGPQFRALHQLRRLPGLPDVL